MSTRKLTIEFYDHKGPFDPNAVEKLDGAERLKRLGEMFESAMRKGAGFTGEIDTAILGQITIVNPTPEVIKQSEWPTYTTFRHWDYS